MVETRSSRTRNNTVEQTVTANKPNDPTAKTIARIPMPAAVSSLSFRVIEDINKKLSPHQKDVFAKTCFGPFLKLERFHYSTLLIHQVMRQSTFSEKDSDPVELVIAGRSREFGLREFALITGLNCSEFTTLPRDSCSELFGGKKHILCKDVARRFNSCHERDSDSDVIKLAQLYLLQAFLLCKKSRKVCDELLVSLVDNPEEFNKFPWGRYVYECTVKSLRARFEGPQNSPRGSLKGFPFALQCWAFELIPRLGELFGSRIGSHTPRMFNWSFFKKRPRLQVCQRVFNDNQLRVESGLEATESEMQSGYFSYFLGDQEPKTMRRTQIIEDTWPSQPKKSLKICKIAKNNKTARDSRIKTVNHLWEQEPKKRKRTQTVEENLVKSSKIAKNDQATPKNGREERVNNFGKQDLKRSKRTQISQPEKLEMANNTQATPMHVRAENAQYLKSQIKALKKELKSQIKALKKELNALKKMKQKP